MIGNSNSLVNKKKATVSNKTKDTLKVAPKLIKNDPVISKLENKEDASSRGKEPKNAAASPIRNGPSVAKKGEKEPVLNKDTQIGEPKPSINCPPVNLSEHKKQVSNRKVETVNCKNEVASSSTLKVRSLSNAGASQQNIHRQITPKVAVSNKTKDTLMDAPKQLLPRARKLRTKTRRLMHRIRASTEKSRIEDYILLLT